MTGGHGARSDPRIPRTGDVVHVATAASVQFAGNRAMNFRVIRIDSRITYDGWIWLDGYQLDAQGNAVSRRTIFVQIAGLKPAGSTLNLPSRSAPRNAGQFGHGHSSPESHCDEISPAPQARQ